MPNFTRPNLPYANTSQPNDNRFEILTQQGEPPTAQTLDDELNARVDADNNLQDQIDNLAVGILPGSDDPLNAHKVPTTDGNGNISFIFITGQNVQPAGIGTVQLAPQCATNQILGPASVTGDKVAQQTINEGNMVTGSGSARVLAAGCVTPDKVTDNTLPGAKVLDNSMPGTKVSDNTMPGTKVLDNSLPGSKMVTGTVTNRELSNLCTWKPGDLKMSVAPVASPGFLNCNGGLYNRVTYADLFNTIGTTYGAGDGNTTFAVPDFRGRVPVGFDYTQSGNANATGGNVTNAANDPNGHAPYTIAYQGGEQAHALTANENGPHTHNYQFGAIYNTANSGAPPGVYGYNPQDTATSSSGNGDAHNNMQPYGYSIMWIYAGV